MDGYNGDDLDKLLAEADDYLGNPKRPKKSNDPYADALRRQGAPENLIRDLTAIGWAESSGNPRAVNPGVGAGGKKTKEYSIGPWQINTLAHPQYDKSKLTDWDYSAKAALEIYRKQGLKAWGAYTDGRYKQYLKKANTAMRSPSVAPLPTDDLNSLLREADTFLQEPAQPQTKFDKQGNPVTAIGGEERVAPEIVPQPVDEPAPAQYSPYALGKAQEALQKLAPVPQTPDNPAYLDYLKQSGMTDSNESRKAYNDAITNAPDAFRQPDPPQQQIRQPQPQIRVPSGLKPPPPRTQAQSGMVEPIRFTSDFANRRPNETFQQFFDREMIVRLRGRIPGATDYDIQRALDDSPTLDTEGQQVRESRYEGKTAGALEFEIKTDVLNRIEASVKRREAETRAKSRIDAGESDLDVLLDEELISPESYTTAQYERQVESDNEKAARDRFLAENPTSDLTDPNFLSGVSAARFGDGTQLSPESRNQRPNAERLDDILRKYGSAQEYYKAQERIREEYKYRPLAEPLEFAGNLARSVAAMPAYAGQFGVIALTDLNPWLKGVTAEQNPVYQALGGYRQWLEDQRNPDLDAWYVRDLPDGLGQLASQALLAPFTGGASVLLPIAQGAVEQYDASTKSNASNTSRNIATIVGGLAAVPEVLLNVRYIGKALPENQVTQIITGWAEKLFGNLAKVLPEAEARQLTSRTIGAFLQQGVRNGVLGAATEYTQERVEDTVNKLVGKLSYKPEVSWTDVFVPNSDEQRGYLVAGVIGTFGGNVNLAIQKMSTSELQKSDEVIAKALREGRISQENAETLAREVADEARRRNVNLSPTGTVEQLVKNATDRFFAEKEASRNKVASGVFETLQPITAPTTVETEQQTVVAPETSVAETVEPQTTPVEPMVEPSGISGQLPTAERPRETGLNVTPKVQTQTEAVAETPVTETEAQVNQIKSVNNRGSFSTEDDTILKSVSAPVSDLGFYSAVEQTILDKTPNKAGVDQVRSILNPQKSAVKQEEIDWLGLDEFLSGKQSVTKQELLDFVRANNVEIEEIVKDAQSGTKNWSVLDNRADYLGDREISVQRDSTGWYIWDADAKQRRASGLSSQNDAITLANDTLNLPEVMFDDTKFSDYQLEGDKENYRELLLTLPPKETAQYFIAYKAGSTIGSGYASEAEARAEMASEFPGRTDLEVRPGLGDRAITTNGPDNFRSSHFSEPNILAHVRFNERTDAEGKRVLFIEEIQSDWLQALRQGKDVPDAPFKKSWQELAMKRVLRYAAENGFDKVAWTTGEQQADRYNLAKQVSEIKATDKKDGGKDVIIDLLAGPAIGVTVDHSGIVTKINSAEEQFDKAVGKPLEDVIGKEPARKILEDGMTSLKGDDLKIGGRGMQQFYDVMLPAFVNKYTKKWGGRVATTQLNTAPDARTVKDTDPAYVRAAQNFQDTNGTVSVDDLRGAYPDATESELRNAIKAVQGASVHSVDITPSMRESVMQGQPLFAKRDRDRTARLNETLPYETELHKVVENIESRFDDNGELELNEYASETIRRVLAEMSNDPYETSFDGVTIPQAMARKIANRIRGTIKAMDKAGYNVAPITQLVENLDKLATAKPFGIVYVFDDVLPEERVHVEDLTLGRTDSKAVAELKQSPIWQKSRSGRFSREYGNQSEANQISEIAAKLATDQSAKYGWTGIDNFETEKTKFLNAWADGILRGNESTIEEIGAEAFIASYPTIGTYGKVTTGDTKGTGNQRTSASADETRTAKEADSERQTQADERSDRDTETAQSETDRRLPADGKLKKRQFAVSMAEQLFDIGDVQYEAQTEKGWSEKAIAKVEQLGTEKAIDEYRKLPANESAGNKTALGIGIAIDLYQKGEFKQLTEFGRELTENIGNAAQELRAAALLSRLSPVFAEAYAERIVKRNLKRAATEDEKTAARVLAEKLADLSNKVEMTQAALEQQTAISKDLEDAAKEIEQMLADERGKVADEKRKNVNLTAALKRAKEAAQRIKTPRTRTPAQNKKLRQDIEAEKASLMDIIKRSLLGNVLKSVTGDTSILKSVSSSLDPQLRDAYVKLSAAKMIDEFGKSLVDAQGNKQNDPFTLAKFDEWLDGLAQQSLSPDDRAEIHAMAYDMIRPQRQTIGIDATQRTRNRMEHAKAARKIIPDQQADAIKDREAYRRDRFAQAMVETARDMGATPEETYMAFGIRELGDKRKLEPEFKREFPDANFDKTLLAGENIYKETKARLDRARIELREGRKLSDKELFDIKHADKLNRGAAYNARRNLERYYRELAKSTGRKAADRAFEVLGLPKTLMSTGEVSFALRQGFIPFLLFNKEWREGTKGIVKGMSDPTKRIAYEQELRDDPYFTMAEHYGVAFNQIGNRARIDEHFPTKFIEDLANADTKGRNIAAVGAIKAARLQQRFEHAYTLPGDAMRLGLFKNLAQVAEQSITDDPAKLEQAYKYAAYIANISVGKGSVEKVFGTDAMFTRFLNTVGFAPGYLMSRIEAGFHYSPIGVAVAYSRGGAGMAKQMARKSMRMYGSLAGAAILMQGLIAGVSGAGDGDKEPWYTILDPKSPNFMKLRWPNGIKTDITANLSDWGKLFLPNFMASGWHAVQEAAGNDEAGYEKAVDVWGKDWNKFFGSWRYWRGKLSPTASAAVELYDGKTYLGRPITPWGMITSRTAPLTYQQAYDAFFYDPADQFMREPETFKRGVDRLMDLNNESLSGMGKRAANSLTLFGLAGVGIGAQQYERFERSPAEEKAASIYGEIAGGGKSGRKSDEQRRIEAGLRDLFRYRDQLAEQRKDTQWVTDASKRYAQKYNVPPDVRSELKDQAQTSSLKFYTQRMTAAQVREVLKYATFEEQSELLDILKKKESNEEKRKAKSAK